MSWTARIVTAAFVIASVASARAEPVAVSGSNVTFESEVPAAINDKEETLVLTGTALRTKFFLNVYAIGSYVQKGAEVKQAEELAEADIPKQLRLVLERDIDGAKMADAVKESITANYDPKQFEAEMGVFLDFIKASPLSKGDQVKITHIPGKGVECLIAGKRAIRIENLLFSRAVWDIYFGKKNIGVAIKRNLTSRL